jgi:hypothetical protein
MSVTRDVAVGELRLLRAWTVEPICVPSGALYSTYISHVWVPGDNTAHCKPQTNNRWDRSHRAPDANCHCGLYGVFDAGSIPDGIVMGIAEYWGRVRMGSRGIRAEHARVVAICPRHGYGLWFSPDTLAIIGDAYNAEVHQSLDDLLAANANTLTKPSEFGLGPPVFGLSSSGFGIGE